MAEARKCEQLLQDKARVAEVLAQLTNDSEWLAAKLTEAREKQKLLILREQTAHSRIRARAQVENQRMNELMARFEGFRGRVEHDQLELNDEIEHELARLKGQKVEA